MSVNITCGNYMRREKVNKFYPKQGNLFTNMFYWMDFLANKFKLEIVHKQNNGFEIKFGCFYVDGYCKNHSLIFEYLSCYHHACERCFTGEKYNKYKIFFDKRKKHDQNRKIFLKKLNLTIIEIWDCQFKELLKTNMELLNFVKSRRSKFYNKYPGVVSESTIIKEIKSGLLFGFIDANWEVPDKWPNSITDPVILQQTPYEYFSEMPPIYGNTTIEFKDFGEKMKEHIIKFNKSKSSKKLLISTMKSKRLLISTNLAQFYLELGLSVYPIFEIIEFDKKKAFKKFTDEVTNSRRNADCDVKQQLSKITGNASYGSLMINKLAFSNIKYSNNTVETCMAINKNNFKKLDEIGENIYEIHMNKRTISLDTPLYVANFILNQAKLMLLKFYYNFLVKYLEPDSYQLLESDTDSLYLALSGNDLISCVKTSMKDQFIDDLFGHCNQDQIKPENNFYFPRECCQKHNLFDQKEPGILKIEFNSGQSMVSLCSKTYAIMNKNSVKFSSKGINKESLSNVMEMYKKVLTTEENVDGYIKGFRQYKNKTYTYHQSKTGLNYVYVKREVLADGISTKPLNVTICPYTQLELDCLEGKCIPSKCPIKIFCQTRMNRKNKTGWSDTSEKFENNDLTSFCY